MNHYVGIDVSLEASSLCVVDANGKIVREGKVASEPDALIAWLRGLKLELKRIGLEAGPLSQWLYAAMCQAGLAVELLETRHVHTALETMPVKSDRNDARGIAQLMRLGWFRPVHCKSMAAQETRALLTARKLLQTKLHDLELSLRGILRGFGLKVGPTTPARFEERIRELVAGHPSLEVIADGLLAARVALRREFDRCEKQVRDAARCDRRARLLMSIPGVGAIVSLTFAAAIDDPARFKSSKQVGAYFGLTPTKYQSGETDIDGSISKIGDASVRASLYESANIILTKPLKGCRWRWRASSRSSCIGCWPMAQASVMRRSEAERPMMAHVMIARCASVPSSPAQLRAAARLPGYDGPTRPSQKACRSINAPLLTSRQNRSDYTVLGRA